MQRWSPRPCHGVGALEMLADQTQGRTPPHQDGALGLYTQRKNLRGGPGSQKQPSMGSACVLGTEAKGSRPRHGEMPPQGAQGPEDRAGDVAGRAGRRPGGGRAAAGLCWMCRSSPSREGETERTAPREATAREQTRPWGLFAGNLSQLPGARPWADATQAA